MDIWAVILAVIRFLIVICYEVLIVELIPGIWHKMLNRKGPKPENIN